MILYQYMSYQAFQLDYNKGREIIGKRLNKTTKDNKIFVKIYFNYGNNYKRSFRLDII